jgi:DNA-binding NarL/FixJ family response regulator
VTARRSHLKVDPVAADRGPTPGDGGHSALTPREREVLRHVVAGRSNAEIAKVLFISDKTVSVHVSNILRKSGTATRVEAAAWAARIAKAAR